MFVDSGHYPFTIEDIAWPVSHAHLPDATTVDLPSSLVDANEIDDDEWDDCIFEALTAKFGVRPIDFGGFEPAD